VSPAPGTRQAGWADLARRRGVRLRARGAGPPVVVFPGLEGSGESCLHLVLPVAAAAGGAPHGRVILVDYAAERHRVLGELVSTVSELLGEVLSTGQAVTIWGQSFGNLLGALVAQRGGLPVRRAILKRLAKARAFVDRGESEGNAQFLAKARTLLDSIAAKADAAAGAKSAKKKISATCAGTIKARVQQSTALLGTLP